MKKFITVMTLMFLILGGIGHTQVPTEPHTATWPVIDTQMDGTPEKNLTGYLFCMTNTKGVYDESKCQDIGNITEHPVTLPSDGQEYCFTVKGYDIAGNIGPLYDAEGNFISAEDCLTTADIAKPAPSSGCSWRD